MEAIYELVRERFDKILKLNKKNIFNDLRYHNKKKQKGRKILK